jgi:hypothetical protein
MSLPAFSYKWVGGDINGLQSFVSTCTSTASQLDDVDRALSSQVSQVVGDGGWTGSAAQAFSTAWDTDSKAGSQLAGVWRKIGSIVGDLAQNLASLEHALEEAAYQLEKQGVAVNPADGTAMPDVAAGQAACLSPQATAKNAKLASAYETYRTEILAKADTARAQAASSLASVTQSMLPKGTNWDKLGLMVNGLDGVRGLWAAPTTYRRALDEKAAEAEKSVKTTQRAAWQEYLKAKQQYGSAARLSQETRANASNALKDLKATEGRLADAPPESPATKLFDGDSAGLGLTGVASGAVRTVPYVGALAGAGITVAGDRSQGESWGQSVSDGVVSNGAALGAGLGTAAFIGGGSIVAVGGGVIAGGVVAVGVGDFVHNAFQENWGQDIHNHGVIDGTLDGVGHTAEKTGSDLWNMAKSLNPF